MRKFTQKTKKSTKKTKRKRITVEKRNRRRRYNLEILQLKIYEIKVAINDLAFMARDLVDHNRLDNFETRKFYAILKGLFVDVRQFFTFIEQNKFEEFNNLLLNLLYNEAKKNLLVNIKEIENSLTVRELDFITHCRLLFSHLAPWKKFILTDDSSENDVKRSERIISNMTSVYKKFESVAQEERNYN